MAIGRADIAVTCEHAEDRHGAFWMEQTDSGWVAHTISGLTGTKFDRIELYDFDGDGDLDLLTCEERENLGRHLVRESVALEGRSKPRFTA